MVTSLINVFYAVFAGSKVESRQRGTEVAVTSPRTRLPLRKRRPALKEGKGVASVKKSD